MSMIRLNKDISSLIIDYSLLNSFIQSDQFDKSLELYSILSNIYFSNKNKISLKILIKEIIEKSNNLLLNQLKELINIFNKLEMNLLINSYDLINQFYLSKFNLKLITFEKKSNEILGITIRYGSSNDHRIFIGTIIYGSIAQNLFSIGDQLIEINNINIQSNCKTLDEIVQLINSINGYISFTIIQNNQHFNSNHSSFYVRSLYSYNSLNDFYIPCKQLGLSFKKDQILKIVNDDNPFWWQAFIIHNYQKQILPGIIPSNLFQIKRLKFLHSFYHHQKSFSFSNLHFYERVKWFIPNDKCKRPIIFIGPLNIIQDKFQKDLINSSELSSLIHNIIPYTTRLKKDHEIHGIHFYFITIKKFQNYILNNYFIQYYFYQEHFYGISKLSIINNSQILNQISILNLLPEQIKTFKHLDLYPYVIYLQIPSQFYKLNDYLNLNQEQFIHIKQFHQNIQINYSNLIDKTILLNKSYQNILSQLKYLIKNIQNKSMWINQFYFSVKE